MDKLTVEQKNSVYQRLEEITQLRGNFVANYLIEVIGCCVKR